MTTQEQVFFKLALKSSPSTEIGVTIDNENEQYFFHHVLTGSLCESVRQCFQGWSEQDSAKNDKWNELISEIEKLGDGIWDYSVDTEEGETFYLGN